MFLRVFLCVLLFTATTSAQIRSYTRLSKTPSVRVAVSPDGVTVAIARSSNSETKRYGRVELWNTNTGELQGTITGFDGPIWSLTFSRDGRSVITVSTEYRESKIQASIRDRHEKVFAELKWWDAQTGEFVKKIPLAEEGVASVEAAWSPAGDAVAVVERYSERQLTQVGPAGPLGTQINVPVWTSIEERNLKLLDGETGERRVKLEDVSKTFHGHLAFLFGRMEHPVFSPNGKTLAAISGKVVNLWSVDTGRKLRALKKLSGAPAAIAFSPDNRLVAVASVKRRVPGGESEITVWDASTGKVVNRLNGNHDTVVCLQFVDDGRALLMGTLQYDPEGEMGTVKLWNLHENRLERAAIHEGKAVSSLTLVPNQPAVVVQSGPQVELRHASTWGVIYSFASTEEDKEESMRRSRFLLSANLAEAVAFSKDGTMVSAEIPGEGIRRWDARTGGLKDRIPRKQDSESVIALSSAGDSMVEANAQGMRLMDLATGTSKALPVQVADPISAFALSPDGQLLVIGSGDEITVMRVVDGAREVAIDAGQEVTAVAIDASGRMLAAARADRSIGLWDLKTRALQGELRKHQDVVNALAFSPEGRMLASGSDDRTAVLWELASGKAKRTLKGHELSVTSLAFSPDGLTLASGSGNASVVLWNVTTGKLDRILR